jgi:hypothetical protein
VTAPLFVIGARGLGPEVFSINEAPGSSVSADTPPASLTTPRRSPTWTSSIPWDQASSVLFKAT